MRKRKKFTVYQLLAIARMQRGIDDDLWRSGVLPRYGAKPDQNGRVSAKSLNRRNAERLLADLEGSGPDGRFAAMQRESAALAEHDGLVER